MGYSVLIPNGILSMCYTDFKCPDCECPHTAEDWMSKIEKSKNGIVYIKCKGCKRKMGVTTDIMGDVVRWMKSGEKNKQL